MKTLSSVGLSTKDETVLKALVDLLGPRTRESWVYSSERRADAVILDTDNTQEASRWLAEQDAGVSTSIAYSGGVSSLPAQHYLTKPLRAADLIAVLNTIVDRPVTAASANPAAVAGAAASATEDPGAAEGQTPAQQLSDRPSGYVQITAAGETLVFDRGQRLCQSSLPPERLRDWLHGEPADFAITWGEDPVASPGNDTGGNWRPDRDLLWALGLHGSRGRLLRQLDPASRFKLLRWPDPALLRLAPYCVSLCALLSRKSGVTLDEIAAVSDVPRADAVSFMNAASLTGILTVRTVKIDGDSPRRVAEASQRGLFAKIRSRLKV
ncbi:MAG: hypothetical protein JJ867_11535 [Marinobacter sp.]|nr:hypothetical protein [Marinobacter sp.]